MTFPCIGLLVPYAEADAAIKCQLYEKPLVEQKLRIAEAGLEKLNGVIETERKRGDRLNALVEKALDEPWYESNTLWFVLGTASTLLIVFALDGADML